MAWTIIAKVITNEIERFYKVINQTSKLEYIKVIISTELWN
jgi:hypothetical protein